MPPKGARRALRRPAAAPGILKRPANKREIEEADEKKSDIFLSEPEESQVVDLSCLRMSGIMDKQPLLQGISKAWAVREKGFSPN